MSFGDLYDLATGKPRLPALSKPAAVPAPVEPAVAAPAAPAVTPEVNAPVIAAASAAAEAPVDAAAPAPVEPAVNAPALPAVEPPATAPVERAVTAPAIAPVDAAAIPVVSAAVEPPVNAEVTAPAAPAAKPPVTAPVMRPSKVRALKSAPAVKAPVAAPVVAPVTGPVPSKPLRSVSGGRSDVVAESDGTTAPLDATHTSAEAKIYSVMYRATVGRGAAERRFTVPELMKATGIRSDKTVRTALHGLAEKLSITVVDRNRSSNHGPLYRVHHPRDVMSNRRKCGLRIDEQTKRIVGAVGAPVTGPVTTSVDASVAAPANFTGGVTDRSLHVFHEHDHDFDAIRDAILQLVPSENDAAVAAAVNEISSLVAESIREAGKFAKQPPATAAYAVECVRRSIAARTKAGPRRRGESEETVTSDAPTDAAAETIHALLKRVADQFRKSHPDASDDAVLDRLHEFVRREGWNVDDDELRASMAQD